MKVLVVSPSISIDQGGPSYSTVNLCRSLVLHGIDVTLFTSKPSGRIPDGTGNCFQVRYFNISWPKRFWNSNDLVHVVKETGKESDIIHIQGLWSFIGTRCATLAKKLSIPYVITPRGMLSAWKQSLHNVHKLIYFSMVERKTVQEASLIHFLTDIEAESSKSFCGSSPLAVIPNGIWLDEFEGLRPDSFRKRFNLDDSRLVMFLGRLHPIKRLYHQCQAFSLLAKRFPNLKWVFVGPDDGVADYIRNYMKDTDLSKRIVLTGLLSGQERFSALAAATVYCHTSEHEGHSVAITEALAAGKPCVVTKGCHFDEVETINAGRVVFPLAKDIATAVEEILLHDKLRETMSENARSLAWRKYRWDIIAKQMIDVYRWVLGQGEKPDCVTLD